MSLAFIRFTRILPSSPLTTRPKPRYLGGLVPCLQWPRYFRPAMASLDSLKQVNKAALARLASAVGVEVLTN